jgi:CubicO group peptidase (beta-lactamase class C family)
MSNWAIANLDRGHLKGHHILQPQSYNQLWHNHVQTGATTWNEAVGLSWFFGTYRGHSIIHHGGSDPGFGTELVLFPDQGDAIIVLANSNTAAVGAVTDAALDLLLGLEPQLPLPPITLPLSVILETKGHVAAMQEYYLLQTTEPQGYDFSPSHFLNATWGAIEAHRADSVMPFLQLWIALQPESSLAHEMMGWAHWLNGDEQPAAQHLRRALELEPENDHAAELLRQLNA